VLQQYDLELKIIVCLSVHDDIRVERREIQQEPQSTGLLCASSCHARFFANK
jgi:hypothetical protein